jgi:hypothetical protein
MHRCWCWSVSTRASQKGLLAARYRYVKTTSSDDQHACLSVAGEGWFVVRRAAQVAIAGRHFHLDADALEVLCRTALPSKSLFFLFALRDEAHQILD